MLDAFTSSMYEEAWGRIAFSRALVEVSADRDLKEEVIIKVPVVDGTGHTKVSMRVEYEWKPLMCMECHVFGHSDTHCPKRPKPSSDKGTVEVTDVSKKAKQDDKSTNDDAIKAKANEYARTKGVVSTNQFSASENMNDPFDFNVVGESSKAKSLDETFAHEESSDSEVDEVLIIEKPSYSNKGASTPSTDGYRIIVGWNKDVVDVMVIAQTSQVLHVKIMHKTDQKVLFCSFVYASNSTIDRRQLCGDLGLHKLVTRSMSWVLMGDFNVALDLPDVYSGASRLSVPMYDFKDCVANIEVMDINRSGLQFTWNQKPRWGSGVLKKLDRVMGNVELLV
uniref:RNA-directed DNA polymerase, eukaryota, reverse transcriptase zinc-binding domain protein n=1 Tax=Tanacetum cinerariifolium TaxID=118510 RepID=A0A6L2K5T7_TANCI|nr:hypothetical protein [Tanacetum cinerariifolium]